MPINKKRKEKKVVFLVPGSETASGKPRVNFGIPNTTNKRLSSKFNRSGKQFNTLKTARAFAISKARSLGLNKVETTTARDIFLKRGKK